MSKVKIGNIGSGFSHAKSSTLNNEIKNFEWVFGQILDDTFWCDESIIQGVTQGCKNKYAWIVESRDIVPRVTQFVKENVDLVSKSYKYLFTHNREIVGLAPNFLFIPSHCTWIKEPGLYPKTKMCSLISSSKNWTRGHKNRLSLVEKFRNKVDLYGRGFNEVSRKEDALCDYMFSICIENDSYSGYFSEKILDCFATGTVPIYYGDPDIDKCFDDKGIIKLDDNFDVNSLSKELYDSMFVSVLNNLLVVDQMGETIEDVLWENCLKYYFNENIN